MEPITKICRICEDKSDGAHFGVESCRACAAFFRRSVVMRKKYVCRQGQENCNINKTVRCMCRCCRFLKCLQVGMLKEAVQSPRDQIGKRNDIAEGILSVKLEHADSTSGMDPYTYDTGVETLADVFPTEERLMPMLKKIKEGYEELRTRRAQYKKSMNDVSDPRKICHRHGFTMLGVDHENIVHFVRNSFPKLYEFDAEQRKILYRSFFASFILVDSAYNTYSQGGDQTDRWYISDGNYIDMTDFEYYYSSFQGGIQPDEAARLFRPSFALFVRNILNPMRCLRITEMEFFALVALCFYAHGVEGANSATDKMALEIRDAILRELTFYYTRFAMIKDYPMRLAHLTLILPSVYRITARFREDVEINKLFNTQSMDAKVYNLINGLELVDNK